MARFIALAALALGSQGAIRAATAAEAAAAFDTLVGSYNLVSLGNARLLNYGDTEGGIAAGGSLTIDGGAIAAHPEKTGQPASFASLYVNGAVNYTGNGGMIQMQSGHAALPNFGNGNQWDSAAKRLRHGNTDILSQINSTDPLGSTDPRAVVLNPAWNFAALAATARSISATLAASAPAGSISVVGQNLTFSAGAAPAHGAIVFDFDASLLSGNLYAGSLISNIAIQVPADALFIINVFNANGRTLFGGGINFNYNDSYTRLLWNIVGGPGLDAASQTVTFGNGGQFYGGILAPDFTVKNLNTSINGQIVAGGFDYSGAELHFTGFDFPNDPTETPAPVPEPATYGTFGAAVLLGLAFLRRKAKARRS